ncbi:MAG: pyridoxamine 5'-phosphate oxidase family protein [Candidatus Omnitrophota bacterium]
MMEKHILDNTVSSVLLNQNLGVLATTGEEYPYTSLVGFVPTEDMKNIIFATMRQTRKYNNIKKHPRVSILVNSSTNSTEDFKDAAAITIMGEAVPCSGQERKKMEDVYLKRFPFLEDFIKNPSCEIVIVKVDRYISVTKFQNVREIEII